MKLNGMCTEIFGRKSIDVYNLLWNVWKVRFTNGWIEEEIKEWKEEMLCYGASKVKYWLCNLGNEYN